MNLLHSKMIKASTKGNINKSVQATTIYSCQLYIESFKISHRGYVHFIWMSNNSQINSLRYQSGGKLVQVKETLTINVRSVMKSGKEVYPMNIYLKLVSENGEQIDEYEMPVNQLSSSFKQMEIPMDRGLIYVKARRKQLNINESSELNHYSGNIYRSKIRRTQQFTNLQQYEILQEELNRTKKALEDEEYLNNKLKNDRDILLSTKQELQTQIQTMMIQFTKEISILREHYETRISIREHCYQEEIENQIGTYNSTVQQTKKIMEKILRQRSKMEEENKNILQRLKKQGENLNQKDDIINRMSKEINQFKQSLQNSESKNKIKDFQMLELKNQVLGLQNETQKLNGFLSQKQKQNNQNKISIQKYIQEISELKIQNEKHLSKQIELQQQIKHLKQKQINLKQQKDLLQKNTKLLYQQNFNLKQQLNKLKTQLQEYLYQLQFNENVIGQLKLQMQQKQQEFYQQIKNIQHLYHHQMETIHFNYNEEIKKLNQKIKELEEIISLNKQMMKDMNFDSKSMQTSIKQIKSQETSPVKQNLNNSFSLQDYQDLLNQNKKMRQFLEEYDLNFQDIDNLKLKQGKKELPDIYQRHNKGIKPIDYDNEKSKIQLQKILQHIPTKKDEVREFVSKKDMEIGQLKHRVDYLEGLYEHLNVKINKILDIYPEVDVKVVEEQMPPFIQICDSQIDQQMKLNENLDATFQLFAGPLTINEELKDKQKPKNYVSSQRIQHHDHDHHNHDHNHDRKSQKPILSKTRKDSTAKQQEINNQFQFQSQNPKKTKNSQSKHTFTFPKKENLSQLSPPINKKNNSDHKKNEENENKIKSQKDIRHGILRKESLPSGNLAVETNSPMRLKKQDSIKSQIPSSKSATSYIKVSHSKKIKQLEESNYNLKQRQKELQAEIKMFEFKLQELQIQSKKYKDMFKEYDSNLVSKLKNFNEQNKSVVNTNHNNENHQNSNENAQNPQENKQNNQNPNTNNLNPNTNNQNNQKPPENALTFQNFTALKKESKQSQVDIQDQRFSTLMKQSQLLQIRKRGLQDRLNQYSNEMKNLGSQLNKLQRQNKLKQQAIEKQKQKSQNNSSKLQSMLVQYQKTCKNYEQLRLKYDKVQRNLHQIEQKYKEEKQLNQDLRLQAKQLNMRIESLQNELKKNKNQNQNLEQKYNKTLNNELIIRELNKEIDDHNKKQLEQLKIINHIKLQRDNQDEEIKLFKKKYNDEVKKMVEFQQKIAALDRFIEENKRKENKLKRQIQQNLEDIRRIKSQSKKAQEQLQAVSAAQATWQVQRRKYLDQISNLQDQMSRKDYQYSKLNKQVQKWKMRSEQRQQYRMGKKSQLREQIQRLQNQLIRKQKRCVQFSEENKLLKSRLQLIERQNKKIFQQKNQNYGQKLKYYVDQMSNIKKLLSQYQNQNNRLKIQNNELYEQGQIMRINYDKLQLKYNDNIEREQIILNDLQSYINEINILNKKLNQNHININDLEYAYTNVMKQQDNFKLQYYKLQQKYGLSQKDLERLENQIKDYKIKLSQYQTNYQIHHKLMEKYRIMENNKNQIQDELKKIKNQYNQVINIFVYKKEDVDKIINDIKNYEKKIKDEEIAFIKDDYNKALSSKTQRLQQEILDLYNQINKIGLERQNYIDQNDKINKRNIEIQVQLEKLLFLQNQFKQMAKINQEMQQQIKKKNENAIKMKIQIERIDNQYNIKDKQGNSYRNKIKQLEEKIEQITLDLKNRKINQNQLKEQIDRLNKIKNNKEKLMDPQIITDKKKQTQMIQQYQLKIYNLQLQIQKNKDKQIRNMEENGSKMKKLELKMEEMEQALKQRQKQMQNNYQYQLQEIQNELYKLSQELQAKMIRQQELKEAILHLQSECKLLQKEKEEMGMQFDHQNQNWQSQIMKLRSKIKQTQVSYENNLKSLQAEIFKANHDNKIITSRTITKSGGGDNDDKVVKRYQQKIKNKDKKIQDLKQTVYSLQQEIQKIKKKQAQIKVLMSQMDKLKQFNDKYQQSSKETQQKYNYDLNNYTIIIKEMKYQLLTFKENDERSKLKLQEKQLQHKSVMFQLATVKELYQQLQKQLEKRKKMITNDLQMNKQHDNYMIIEKQNIIRQLQEKNMILVRERKQIQILMKKNHNQMSVLEQKIQNFRENQNKLKSNQQKINNQMKKIIDQYTIIIETLKIQLKTLKSENVKLKRHADNIKDDQQNEQMYKNQTQRQIADLLSRLRSQEEIVQKYYALHQKCVNQLSINLEDLPIKFLQMLEEKDNEINQLMNEIQQLKFLNQRKYLDYDEIKRQNLQLQLKNEDNQILNEQIDNLRKICDKIQEQKKQIIFRQQVLRMQIQNLAANGPIDFRNRIENILTNANMMPSYSNFSFY